MNWYKKAQSELWNKSKEEVLGPFNREQFDVLTPEQQDQYWSEARKKRKEWGKEVQKAISLGLISPQEADKKGWIGMSVGDTSNIRPLPPTLYHVTTNKKEVLSGRLKSREELNQSMGTGLGGGDSETVSFTTDLDIANGIYNAIKEAKTVASGQLSIKEMINQASKGSRAQKPWINDIIEYYKGQYRIANSPGGLLKIFDSPYRYEGSIIPRSVEERNRDNDSSMPWEPVLEKRWPYGEREAYTEFRRKMTPEEFIERKFEFYKSWSFFREHAGGPLNPLFFLSDPIALSKVPDEQIAILQFKPKPGAYGYIVSGLGEWRTWTGEAVEFVREISV